MMIIRLPAQRAFFFHGWRVALAIVAIAEGKLRRDLTAKSRSSSSHWWDAVSFADGYQAKSTCRTAA